MGDNMQFADPGQNQYWYGYEQQDADPVVANEEPASFTTSIPPPPPPPPPFPDYQYPGQQQYRRSRSSLWIVLVLAVLLLIGGGVAGFFLLRTMHGTPQTRSNSNGTSAQVQAHGQLTLSVTSHPTVIIENDAGFIHVKAGSSSDVVTLQLGQSPNSSSGSGTIPYTETSDHSTIILSLSPPDGSDLTVTVPATSDLKLYTNDGEIMVDGVSGQMNLVSNTGSVTVTHSTINSASVLNDNTGAINATQDMLQGRVTLSNNSGNITFSGSIDPAGIYTLQDNGGTVDMSLPRTASFHIDATSNNSSVSSNFPSIHVQNGEIHASVGKTPRATVTLYNNGGTISLHVN